MITLTDTHRRLILHTLLLAMLLLGACGGDSGGGPGGAGLTRPEPVTTFCQVGSAPAASGCQPYAERVDARATTPFVERGEPVTLEVVLFKPPGAGRFPTVVFHHGSTGSGADPSRFGLTFTSQPVTRYFVARGWMVAFPQRRGRGRSDGLYDEGFRTDRSGYSCRADLALGGAERALDDLDAITDWLRMRADVDTTRMLVAGSSRGGILAVAHLARRPEVYRGAVNFVGGWLAEGCGDHRRVNEALFVHGAGFPGPTLWLYGERDSFYGMDYSRANFAVYSAAGGLGDFLGLSRHPGLDGHYLVNDGARWAPYVDTFLDRL